MRVIILTEGGSDIGLGHLSRCSSLYDELWSRNYIPIEFWIAGSPEVASTEFLKEKKFSLVNWRDNEFINSYIYKTDYCIIDSYLLSKENYQLISEKAYYCLYIDDNSRLEYPRGTVVNPSIYVDETVYPTKNEVSYLFGSPYVILRKPFVSFTRKLKFVSPIASRVIITMGGSDNKKLIPMILESLCRKWPSISFDIVIGSSVPYSIEKLEAISTVNVTIHKNLSAINMSALMLQADIAITAAGQTLYELLATNTPFIPVKTVDNQNNNILGLKIFNPHQQVLDCDEEDFINKLNSSFANMLSLKNRTHFLEQYNYLVDGLGASRIVDHLLAN